MPVVLSLDLETTGLSTSRDRIVEVALVRQMPDGSRQSFSSLVNPTIPIHERARLIHGISDETVAKQPTFVQVAPKLIEFINTSILPGEQEEPVLCGHNILRFDLPMLQAELLRAGFKMLDLSRFTIVDSLVVFRKMEPHTLTKAVEFYCPDSAVAPSHRASADAEAALNVWLAQSRLYQQDAKQIASFCANGNGPTAYVAPPPTIARATENKVQQKSTEMGKGFSHPPKDSMEVDKEKPEKSLTELDVEGRLLFGKHKGERLSEVAKSDRAYLRWLLRAAKISDQFKQAVGRLVANN